MDSLKKQQSSPISIVIPAFNEADRLPRTLMELKGYIESQHLHADVVIVDDGSNDATVQKVLTLQRAWPELRLFQLKQNQGKGAAVREGVRQARFDQVLIADADGATPWSELEKLQTKIKKGPALVMGSRAFPQSEIIVRQAWWRERMGKIFNGLMRWITGLSYLDTQCGFKLLILSAELKKDLLKTDVDRFAWDVEWILKTLEVQGEVVEVPVKWAHKEASRVHPVWDSLEMLLSVVKIRLKLTRRNK